MSDVLDSTGGWAKAIEATANASKEAVEASRALGRFISGPAGEVAGMLWDHLKVVRFERQIRLLERARQFLAERGMDGPTRTIALNIGLPLLDNATLEEDDALQDVWARLLVNGGDANSGIAAAPESLRYIVRNSKRDVILIYSDLMLRHPIVADALQKWKDSGIQKAGKF